MIVDDRGLCNLSVAFGAALLVSRQEDVSLGVSMPGHASMDPYAHDGHRRPTSMTFRGQSGRPSPLHDACAPGAGGLLRPSADAPGAALVFLPLLVSGVAAAITLGCHLHRRPSPSRRSSGGPNGPGAERVYRLTLPISDDDGATPA